MSDASGVRFYDNYDQTPPRLLKGTAVQCESIKNKEQHTYAAILSIQLQPTRLQGTQLTLQPAKSKRAHWPITPRSASCCAAERPFQHDCTTSGLPFTNAVIFVLPCKRQPAHNIATATHADEHNHRYQGELHSV